MLFSLTPKIVCVGLPKTCTCSLECAIERFGYETVGWDQRCASFLINGEIHRLLDVLIKFEACRDFPWALAYKKWDTLFPGSKFILTVRDEASWIKSNLKHFDPGMDNPRRLEGAAGAEIRKWSMGYAYPQENPEGYLAFYRKHNAEVIDYFSGTDKLLVMNIEAGDGWAKLCPFLGVPTLDEPFPHANKAEDYHISEIVKAF